MYKKLLLPAALMLVYGTGCAAPGPEADEEAFERQDPETLIKE